MNDNTIQTFRSLLSHENTTVKFNLSVVLIHDV